MCHRCEKTIFRYKSKMAREAERRARYWEGVQGTAESVLRMSYSRMYKKDKQELKLHRNIISACQELVEYLKNVAR